MRHRHAPFQHGLALSVSWIVTGGESQPREYFDETLDESERIKAVAIFSLLANKGWINNREKFKHLKHGDKKLYEIKPTKQDRFLGDFCTLHEDRHFLVVWAVRKKQDKHKPADLDRALRLLKEFHEGMSP